MPANIYYIVLIYMFFCRDQLDRAEKMVPKDFLEKR